MSSSDASDLVDTDEDGVAPAPASTPSLPRKRLFLRLGSTPPSCTASPAGVRGKKRPRLELEGSAGSTSTTTISPWKGKGKNKATSCSDEPGSPISFRKKTSPAERTSSTNRDISDNGSRSSDGGCSRSGSNDSNDAGRRENARKYGDAAAGTPAAQSGGHVHRIRPGRRQGVRPRPRSSARGCSQENGSDSHVGSEDATECSGTEEEEGDVEVLQLMPAEKAKGQAAGRGRRNPVAESSCAKSGAITRSSHGPDAPYVASESAAEYYGSEEEELDVELIRHSPTTKAKGRTAPGESSSRRKQSTPPAESLHEVDCTRPRAVRVSTRSKSKELKKITSEQSLYSSSEEDVQCGVRPPFAMCKSGSRQTESGDRARRRDSGKRRGSNLQPISLSDDEDCLRNTDSDDAAVPGGSDGESGGSDVILCSCGARNWRDGARWIRCDARGCTTWEHLACVYPGRLTGRSSEGGQKGVPESHLCRDCKTKGVSVTPTKKRKGKRLSLTHSSVGGDVRAPSSCTLSTSAVSSPVRRSRRVSEREGMKLVPRKNVVGDEEGCSSSLDDDLAVLEGVDGSGCGGGLGGVDGTEAESDVDSDDFLAPEGKIEYSQEYRCRCGGIRRSENPDNGAGGGKDDRAESWVQCYNDACGVWEHAACCDLCLPSTSSSLRTVPSHGQRHWCRTCDPKGIKHRKWQDKQQRRLKRAAKEAASPERPRRTSKAEVAAVETRGRGATVEGQCTNLLVKLWRAVFSGNGSLLKQTLQEVDDREGGLGTSIERLLEAGQPPPVGCLRNGCPLPAGLSLLMLAAGYWKKVVNESNTLASALTVPVSTSPGAKSSPTEASEVIVLSPAHASDTSEVLSVCSVEKDTLATAAVDAADTSMGATEKAGTPEHGQVLVHPDFPTAHVADPPAQTLVSVTSTASLPEISSGARLEVLRIILEKSGARAVLAVDEEGRTAAHHAAAVNGAGEVAILLEGELGGKAALAMSQERLTPLHISAAAGHSETCVAILTALPQGPRVAVLAASDKQASGENALHLACLEGQAVCVQAILDEEKRLEEQLTDDIASHVVHGTPAETPPTHHPLVLEKTLEGTTPLMAAAGFPSQACVKAVIENLRGRVIRYPSSKLAELRAVDHSGMNALHYAAGRDAEGSVEAAKALLDAERLFACCTTGGWSDAAMINSGDLNNEASPLHLAAAISHKKMVSLLLAEGANSVLEDRQGWTPVMYADFGGRKEGAVLELLQHEPEKQLEALGRVLSQSDGRDHHVRIVEVVRNLATVPSFFSLINGFIRKKPEMLLGSLSFLKNKPGLLDFENKRNLMRTLLVDPDEATRNALELAAAVPIYSFGYAHSGQIYTRRGEGEALRSLLAWMESSAGRWSKSGLAAWLRVNKPSFYFENEAGYGQGVDREAWEKVAGDFVLPYPPAQRQEQQHLQSSVKTGAAARAGARGAGSAAAAPTPGGNQGDDKREPFFVPVDGGMSSYCPRDLRGVEKRGAEAAGGAASAHFRLKKEEDLEAFEFLGMVIGANLCWDKVLNLNLNPVVWKTILSRKVHVSDLNLVDPTYYKSLRQVLEMEGVDQLGLSFEFLELNHCADVGDVQPDDDITDENKAQYASLAVESRTFGRWRKQARALSHGLRRLIPLNLLKMFTENELGLLLAGPGDVDPDDWERNTIYNGAPSEVLKGWFWSVVRSLAKEEKSLLLQFATGCSRLPAGGFKGLSRAFMVMVVEYEPHRPLPRAATCFFTLKLPRYPDLYSLQKYLLVAIRHGSSGFEFS